MLRSQGDLALVVVHQYFRTDEIPFRDEEGYLDWHYVPPKEMHPHAWVPSHALKRVHGTPDKPDPQRHYRWSEVHRANPEGTIVMNHVRSLVSEPGVADQALLSSCGEIQLLDQRVVDGQIFQLVMQQTDGVELRAWIGEPIRYNWGRRNCWPRALRLGSMFRGETLEMRAKMPLPAVTFGGQKLFPAIRRVPRTTVFENGYESLHVFDTPSVPVGYRRVRLGEVVNAVLKYRTENSFYGVRVTKNGAKCVEYRRDGHNWSSAIPLSVHEQGASSVVTSFPSQASDSGDVIADYITHDRMLNQETISSVTIGAGISARIVGSDDHALLFFRGQMPVVAYHPDDAIRWYFERAHCEFDLEKAPRFPISLGQKVEWTGQQPMQGLLW